jgi:hypothetical protein
LEKPWLLASKATRWSPAKFDRLAPSRPDARAVADELTVGQVRLNLGGSVCDPTDPVRRLLPGST